MQPIVHLELHTGDLSAARDYYSRLCGWPTEPVPTGNGPYQAMDVGDGGVGAGIVQCGTPRALWLPYVEVDRVDSATARARDLGARVLLPPREGPAGWRSVVRSATGAELAFWQPKR